MSLSSEIDVQLVGSLGAAPPLAELDGQPVEDYDPELGLPATDIVPRLRVFFTPTRKRYAIRSTRIVTRALRFATGVAVAGLLFWWIGWWWLLFSPFIFVWMVDDSSILPASHATMRELIEGIAADPYARQLEAIVLGSWDIGEKPQEANAKLIELADRFPNLRTLVVGDVHPDDSSPTWIELGDLAPLLLAFPQLEHLEIRGGHGVRLQQLSHSNLRSLTVRNTKLQPEVMSDLAAATLPALEELEIWFADPSYGFVAEVTHVAPLWDPDRFPKLRSLALKNCPFVDDIALRLAEEPEAVRRLDRLDLSLGTLTDRGAAALVELPEIEELDELDLHHHFLSDEMQARLSALDVRVDLSQSTDEVAPPRNIPQLSSEA